MVLLVVDTQKGIVDERRHVLGIARIAFAEVAIITV